MKQPEKWKETIDPTKIKFNNFEICDILGYPHAQNDVFYVKGKANSKSVFAFVKYASKQESNILHEIDMLKTLKFKFLPQILDFDKNGKWCVTKECKGERLSNILKNDKNKVATDFMFEYGKTLAQIHSQKIDCAAAPHRRFFDLPTKEYLEQWGIGFMHKHLLENKPKEQNKCFCHGDFHYANILWKDNKITAVLDWELAGIGNKEFDVAWAIINRPSQNFLKTKKEVAEFLRGYSSIADLNKQYVKYYMGQIYSHFVSVDKNNLKYQAFVTKYLEKNYK